MSTPKQTALIQKLAGEINTIVGLGLEPTLAVRKLSAVVDGDMETYCEILEEELGIKDERIRELERAGEISTEIIERLRSYLDRDQKALTDLQDEHATLVKEFKQLKEAAGDSARQLDAATGLLADSGADRAALERLVGNLEGENRCEGARNRLLEAQLRQAQSELLELKKTQAAEIEANRRYKARYEHAAEAAREAQETAHLASLRVKAAEEQLATIRCAKWRVDE
jgi:hypothetical protein